MCKGSGSTRSTNTSTTPNAQAMGLYGNLLDRAQGVANTPYEGYNGQLVAPVNAQQQQGIGTVNNAQPYYGQAGNLYATNATPLTNDQIQQYQSPYTQDVVDKTMAAYANQNEGQRQQLLGQAAAQGALGGNRIGVAEGELARQQQSAQAPVIAGLYDKSYQSGIDTAKSQQQAGFQGAQGLMGVGAGTVGLGGAQIGAGTLQQQTQQAQNEAAYGQWQNQKAYPFQTTQWLANLGTGVGSQMGGTSSTTAPQPSMWNQLAGGLTSGVGMLGATGAFGSAGWLMPALTALARGGRVKGYASGGVVPDDVIPESEDTLRAQQNQLVNGDRKVQMFPDGVGELPLPEGMQRTETDRGTFHFDPEQTGVANIEQASNAGRENELLDLGPFSKEEVAKLVQQGSHPLVIVERTPDGKEVRAALGTPETVPVQLQAMEKAKSPENKLVVEDLFKVLKERQQQGVGGEQQPVGLAAGGAAKRKIGATPYSDAQGYISVPEFNMVRGSGAPKPPASQEPAPNAASKLGNLSGLGGSGGRASAATDPNEGSLGFANGIAIPGASGSYMVGNYEVPTFGVPGMAHGGSVGVASHLDPAILKNVYGVDHVPGMSRGGTRTEGNSDAWFMPPQAAEQPFVPTPLWESSDTPTSLWESPEAPAKGVVPQTPAADNYPGNDAYAAGVAAPAGLAQSEDPTLPQNGPIPRIKPQMYDNGYKRLAQASAEQWGIPKDIAFGVIQQESAWNPDAVSRAGAGGIAQFMPATAESVGLKDRFNPMQAIPKSMEHLAELKQYYKGNMDYALAAYNAGQPTVDRWLAGKGSLPAETINYVQSIKNMGKTNPQFTADTPEKPATRMAGVAPSLGEGENPASTFEGDERPQPASYRALGAPGSREVPTSSNGVAGAAYNPTGAGDMTPAKEPSGIDWSSNGKLWPSLMAAGFGMMASRSPHLGVAIGEGGQAGVQGYAQMAEAEKSRGQNQQRINLEAKRLQQSADVEQRRAREAEWPYTRETQEQKIKRQQFELTQKRPFLLGVDPNTMQNIYGVPDPEAPSGYRILDPRQLRQQQKPGVPDVNAPGAAPGVPQQDASAADAKPPVWETGGAASDKPEARLPVREYSQAPLSSDVSSAGIQKTDQITDDYIKRYVEDSDRLARRRMRERWNTEPLEAAKADNPAVGNLAEAILEGRQPVPKALTGKYSVQNRQAMELVRAVDPEFDDQYYASKKKARDAFTTGVEGRQIRKFNTTMGHIGEMIMLGRELDNFDSGTFGPATGLVNRGVQAYREGNQDPRLVAYKQTSNAVANELEGAFRGNNTAIAGIAHWRETVAKPSISPQELQSASKNLIHLLGSQIESSTAQYAAGLRAPVDTLSLMTAPNREMYKRILNDQNPIVMKFKTPQEAEEAFKKKRLQVGDDFVDPTGTQRRLTKEGAATLGKAPANAPAAAPAAGEKEKAIEWLKKNPDDPRGEAIRKRFGI